MPNFLELYLICAMRMFCHTRNGNLLQAASAESSSNSSMLPQPTSLSRSLSVRLDTVKNQYRTELEPLMAEKERLSREVLELKDARQAHLEESTTLHARNEELADLQRSLVLQVETAQELLERTTRYPHPKLAQLSSSGSGGASGSSGSSTYSGRPQHSFNSPSLSSLPTLNSNSSGTTTSADRDREPVEEVAKYVKVVKPEMMEPAPQIRKFRWYKGGKESKNPLNDSSSSSHNGSGHGNGIGNHLNGASAPAGTSSSASYVNPSSLASGFKEALVPPRVLREAGRKGSHEGSVPLMMAGGGSNGGGGSVGLLHNLHPHNIPTLRFVRCEHCNDKMWGPITELRCASTSRVFLWSIYPAILTVMKQPKWLGLPVSILTDASLIQPHSHSVSLL